MTLCSLAPRRCARFCLAVLLLGGAAHSQFSAYTWELNHGSYGGGKTTLHGDLLDIDLDPLCHIGYTDDGWARTHVSETGRFRVNYQATSKACISISYCDVAKLVAISGPCSCPLHAGFPSCVDEVAYFNGGIGYLPGSTKVVAGTWSVDVESGDCFTLGAGVSSLSLDCQILATFSGLTFTPALVGTPSSLSVGTGGTQLLALTGPQALGGEMYLVLGTASGTAPGVSIDGVLLPLNPDPYLLYVLGHPLSLPLIGALGVLDIDGLASASFRLPPGTSPALAGTVLHHGFVVFDLTSAPYPFVAFASNPAPLALLP